MTITRTTTTPVSSGVTSTGFVVSSGNTLEVMSGGLAIVTSVTSGGTQQVDFGGQASGTMVSSGGIDNVLGVDGGANVVGGGTLVVSSGGASYFAMVQNTNALETVSSGGDAYESLLSNGGAMALVGGTAFNTDVQLGGSIVVSSGSFASGTKLSGFVSSGTVVTSALETVVTGGTDSGSIVFGGGVLKVSAGGSASGDIIESNGVVVVNSGGSATKSLIVGGTLELKAGAVVSGAINFAGTGGKLKIDGTTSASMPANTISGFVAGNVIDLTSVTFSSGATATLQSGDVLRVQDGGVSYNLQLSTSQNFTGATFAAASDGTSGTKITVSQPISITGATVGFAQKDTTENVSSTLSASDSISGSTVTWSIVGGTTPHAPNYQYAIDQFQVTSGGSVEFSDNFSSLTPPNYSDGQTAHFTVAGGTLSNNGSKDQLLGSNAGVVNASNGTDGQIAYLNTDTSPASPSDGLFSGTSFSVQGTFDLVIPTDHRNGYGIQLTDRGAGDGHDSVRLEVTRNSFDQVEVQLQQINSVTATTTFVQSILLAPAPGDDQIELQLSNNGAVNNGSVTAAFTLLNHGAADSTTDFTLTGTIFAGENWTQASFLGLAPATSDSILAGTYGTLDIEQNGTWAYGLNNSLPAVQALAQDQSATDSFLVQAADNHGDSTITPVTIAVSGDNPTLSVTITGTPGQGLAVNGTQAFNQFLAFGDSNIDSGYFFTHPITNNTANEAQYQAAVAAGGGIPTSIGGVENSTLLARDFGLTAIPVGEAGGTNYAASGATVRGSLPNSLAPNISSQIQSYLGTVNNQANSNAIYLISGGGNDTKIAATLDPVSAQAYMIASANQMAGNLAQLYADGAKYIVIGNLAGGTLGSLYTSTLQQDLIALGVPFIAADVRGLIATIDANPAAYGISNASEPPAGPFTASNGYNSVDGGADLNPNPSTFSQGWALYATQLTSPNAGQTDLWVDDQHLAAAGQAIEANYIYNLIQNAVPTIGETLNVSPSLIGSNGSTANIVYQWQSKAAGQTTWTNISGATGASYLVQHTDLGASLRVDASFTDPATSQLVNAFSPASLTVAAAPLTWIAGVSGDWSTATNWTGGVVPTAADNVMLSNLNSVAIGITISQSAQSLALNDAGTTVTDSAGTLSLAGALTVDGGTFVLQTGGSVAAAEGIFVEAATPGGFTGGTLEVKDGSSLGGSVVDNAIVDFDLAGTDTFTGTLSGGGALSLEGGGKLVLNGTDTYSGGTTVNGSTLELGNSQAAGAGTVTLQGASTLKIDGSAMPTNTIAGMVQGDTIDLASIGFDSNGTADLLSGNKLQIVEHGSVNPGTYDLQLGPGENFTGEYFHLTAAVGGGTAITENSTPCYCPGTLIRTDHGEIAVETLAIGDCVVTKSGVARAIKWIGRRSYGGRLIMGRKDILPICVKAGALDDGVPRRDLWISPHHAMYLEGILIEAKDLVNGASVVQAESVDEVEYFHVELDTHDVIIAEGAFSESFVDDDSRAMFHNAHEYAMLFPDARPAPARYCAPRRDDGYQVEKARRCIDVRAGLRPTEAVNGTPLRGYLELVGTNCIAGWAQNPENPEAPVCLDIYSGGRLIGQTLANGYREDLERAGLGSGRQGFMFTPPAGLNVSPDLVEVRRSVDGADLPRPVGGRDSSLVAA
jgi:VCBS repeat-containing protein/autotransporter passenger strand-loop-strand repeat protein/autotransporter-associated beta strand protein